MDGAHGTDQLMLLHWIDNEPQRTQFQLIFKCINPQNNYLLWSQLMTMTPFIRYFHKITVRTLMFATTTFNSSRSKSLTRAINHQKMWIQTNNSLFGGLLSLCISNTIPLNNSTIFFYFESNSLQLHTNLFNLIITIFFESNYFELRISSYYDGYWK